MQAFETSLCRDMFHVASAETPLFNNLQLILLTLPYGGVAQWTSHPPQDREDPGSDPARVKGF
jgi:hypothetical protein